MESSSSRLPWMQLLVLAFISLAEQTALNSISPYLPAMTMSFPEVKDGYLGLAVGAIATSFAVAQCLSAWFWGGLSDRIGRKPVILLGTLLLMLCFLLFGFCKSLPQAIIVQVLMGLLNGNGAVIPTVLGEITDRSNQTGFDYLPVLYGLGGICGPLLGGLLVREGDRFPYLRPNLVSAFLLGLDFIITIFLLEESSEQAKEKPPLGKRVGSLFVRLWQFTSSTRPTYIRRLIGEQTGEEHQHDHHHTHLDGVEEVDNEDETDPDSHAQSDAHSNLHDSNGDSDEHVSMRDVLNRDVILLFITYFIFNLANVAYNSLYPTFAEEKVPTGRGLKPAPVGYLLAGASGFTIIFQLSLYGTLRESIGHKVTYSFSLLALVVAFALTPWVGYWDGEPYFGIGSGKVWLYGELIFILIIKTVGSVGGVSAALALFRDAAPDNNILGTVNGYAVTVAAFGRALGPFLSGGLFTLATKIKPKGEVLPFTLFAGVSLLGFLLTYGIRRIGADDKDGSTTSDGSERDEESQADENLLAQFHPGEYTGEEPVVADWLETADTSPEDASELSNERTALLST